MVNKFDLEVAIDSYRAQNSKEQEIGLYEESNSRFLYGSRNFSSREQAIGWLKQQKPNHEALRNMIAQERNKNPNSSLEPLFQTYERYYGQMQAVQIHTERELSSAKPIPQTTPVESSRIQEQASLPPIDQDPQSITPSSDGIQNNNENEQEESSEKSIEYYSGYAVRELKKVEKSITDLQQALKSEGFYQGDIHGEFDATTLEAVRQYQEKNEMKFGSDGLVGPATITLLFPNNNRSQDSKTKPQSSPVPPAGPEIPQNESQTVVFRDGAYYMIGQNGNKKRIEYTPYSQSKELRSELTPEQQARMPLVTDIARFLEAYSAQYPDRKDKVSKVWQQALDYLQNGAGDVQKVTNQIVVDTLGVGMTNKKWHDAFAIKDDAKRKLTLYTLMKDMGQYDLVASYIAQEYAKNWTPEQVQEAIAALGQGKTIGTLSKKSSDNIAQEVAKMKVVYQKEWEKNKMSALQEYKKQFGLPPETTLTPEQFRRAEEIFLNNGLDQAFRLALLRDKLNSEVNWKGDHADPTLDLASSILGTGIFNISSRMARGATETLAIEAIAIAAGMATMGVGTVAIHALSAGRLARLVTLGTRAGSFARYGTSTVGMGLAFEAGHGGAKSLIEGENMYSARGFGDAILFTGVLNGVGRLLAPGGKLATLGNWTRTGNGGIQFIKGTLIDGTALNVVGVTSKVFFEKDVHWTPEEMAQAFLMAGLFRGVGKIVAKKTPQGELQVTQEPVTPTVQAKPAPQVTPRVEPTINMNNRVLLPDGYQAVLRNDGKYVIQFRDVERSVWKTLPEKYTPDQVARIIQERTGKSITPIQEMQLKGLIDVQRGTTPTQARSVTQESAARNQQEAPISRTPEAQIIRQAADPVSAERAVDAVSQSSKKIGDTFSEKWIKDVAAKIGKTPGWLADQSVGPLVRILTGSNPSRLISLLNPTGGWGSRAGAYGADFMTHWKHPVSNAWQLLIRGEAGTSIFKNILAAGLISGADYYLEPGNPQALEPRKLAQNYYEVILLGWLGIFIMESDVAIRSITETSNWVSDRLRAKPF